ncbi:MAG: ankyrin repeat domain-containing protein [Fretibacterium sp.]|nr:ankyrin repeat domain-containing protein [Fretibacterium sp.]
MRRPEFSLLGSALLILLFLPGGSRAADFPDVGMSWGALPSESEAGAEFLASLGAVSADALLPDGNRPLHVAAESSDPKLVEWLLKNGASPSAKGLEGLTPLMLAAAYNPNPDVTGVLLRGGSAPDARDESGRTALHLAAAVNESPQVTALLLRQGASAGVQDNAGRTPLWMAAARGESSCVELLLDAGAPVDGPNRENITPLQAACECPDAGVIRALVEAGADVNRRDSRRCTPAMRAVAAGADAEVLRVFIRGKADLLAEDDQNRSALFLAVSNPAVSTDVVSLLLKDENPNTRDSALMTPLMEACRAHSLPTVRLLLEHGASTELRDKSDWTPMTFAVMSNAGPELIRLLAGFGASLELGTRDGITPLMLAAHAPEQLEGLKALASVGADLNYQSRQGMTALMVAAASGNGAAVKELLALSADVSLRDEGGMTALAHAVQAQRDNTEVMERLIRAGAETDTRAEREMTPLMNAALRDCDWGVKVLLAAGADPAARDFIGWTPLHFAARATPPLGLTPETEEGAECMALLIAAVKGSVDLPDDGGTTPLMVAAASDNAPAVRLLLKAGADPLKSDRTGRDALGYARLRNAKTCIPLLDIR